MKHLFVWAAFISIIGIQGLALSEAPPAQKANIVQLTRDDIKWRPGAGGVSFALAYGNPTKSALYAMLVKYPPNFKAPPHFHPIEQVVTVIEGTIYAGLGETFNAGKLKPYTSGSVFTEPLNMSHFSLTKEEGAMVVITGIGPHSTKYVKPAE